MDRQQAAEKLSKYGQEHLLRYFDELNADERAELLSQIDELDLSVIGQVQSGGGRGRITPLSAMELPEIETRRESFCKTGLEAIRAGKVAALILAGGMGTRLGADIPKGTFDIGVTRHVYILQRQIENMLDVVKQAGTFFPLFIMTSKGNREAVSGFLSEHDFFGYDKDCVMFFTQDNAPSTDRSKKIYMESKSRIASSPNGNGGWFLSLMNSGCREALDPGNGRFRQVEWINVFAVDNVLQRIADPVFVGAVIESGRSCGAKVVRKAFPDERVGVMCLEDGHPSIVEYYELTDEIRNAVDEKGEPAYNFGVILNYLFRLDDLKRTASAKMPFHAVERKIPYISENGERISPDEPNGYKYETLALDMIRLLDSCLPFEVVREREFAPVKNPTGIDSVESARELCRRNGIEI